MEGVENLVFCRPRSSFRTAWDGHLEYLCISFCALFPLSSGCGQSSLRRIRGGIGDKLIGFRGDGVITHLLEKPALPAFLLVLGFVSNTPGNLENDPLPCSATE